MTLPEAIALLRSTVSRISGDPAMATTILLLAAADACRDAGVEPEEALQRAEVALLRGGFDEVRA